MTTKFKLILFSISLSCVAHAQGTLDKLDTFLSKFENVNKKVSAVKAEFVQTILFETTGEKQEVIGTIFLKKPSSIYITQRTPQEQKIYINGNSITIFTPKENQAIIDSWKNSIDDDFSPALFVNFGSSLKTIKKTHLITLEEEDDNHVTIRLQSFKNKQSVVKIYIAKASMLPEKAIVNSDDVKIELIFKSYNVNPELDGDIFKFKSKNNVEIIKL